MYGTPPRPEKRTHNIVSLTLLHTRFFFSCRLLLKYFPSTYSSFKRKEKKISLFGVFFAFSIFLKCERPRFSSLYFPSDQYRNFVVLSCPPKKITELVFFRQGNNSYLLAFCVVSISPFKVSSFSILCQVQDFNSVFKKKKPLIHFWS